MQAALASEARAVGVPGTLAGGLVVLFAILAASAANDKCTTFDEVAHLSAGFSYWKQNDFRLHPENGVLSQRLVAAPLLLDPPTLPERNQPAWHRSLVLAFGEQFFYRCGNDPDRILRTGRRAMVAAGVGLGLGVFRWSTRLWGPVGGLLSTTVYAFSPTLLAHSALATSDLPVAAAFLAVLYTACRLCQRISAGGAVVFGMALAAVLLAKFSGLLALPFVALVFAATLWRGEPIRLSWRRREWAITATRQRAAFLTVAGVVAAAIAYVTIWLSYGFRYSAMAHPQPGDRLFYTWPEVLDEPSIFATTVTWLRQHRVLPEAYLFGLAFVAKHSRQRESFFAGEFRTQGWWYFFPAVFLIKTPLPTLFLAGLAVLAMVRHRRRTTVGASRPDGLSYETLVLAGFIAFYFLVAMMSRLNIGHRHLLPIYPPLFILIGACGLPFKNSRLCLRRRMHVDLRSLPRSAELPSQCLPDVASEIPTRGEFRRQVCSPYGIGMSICLVWLIGETVYRYPNYLAYFNALIGGPKNGYQVLVDSSLDWGQELPALRRYLETRLPVPGKQKEATIAASDKPCVYFSYFGMGDPVHYGIQAWRLPGFAPAWKSYVYPPILSSGIYCISASSLQTVGLRYQGAWPQHEPRYRAVAAYVESCRAAEGTFSAPDSATEARLWRDFQELRFARLCHYLRRRQPDDQIHFAILVYHLSEEELHQALYGELQPQEAAF